MLKENDKILPQRPPSIAEIATDRKVSDEITILAGNNIKQPTFVVVTRKF